MKIKVIYEDDPRHGTTNGYINLKCRCERCRTAWSAYCRDRKERRTQQGVPESVEHGKYTTYGNWKCRCEACTKAWNDYWRGKKKVKKAKVEG